MGKLDMKSYIDYDLGNTVNLYFTHGFNRIPAFNYPVFLTPKGWILLPLTNKKIKLDVYDYIEDSDIQKIQKSNGTNRGRS